MVNEKLVKVEMKVCWFAEQKSLNGAGLGTKIMSPHQACLSLTLSLSVSVCLSHTHAHSHTQTSCCLNRM